MSHIFQSGLAADLQSMIDYKVSIGYSENTYLQNSISLDRYCMKYFPEISLLTQEMVTGWLERRPKESPTAFHVRVGYIRGFGKYLKNVGKEAYVIPEKFTSSKTRFIPYIFTDDELSALFHAIDTYPYDAGDALQPYLFSTIFRMIYTCGLRPNEGRTLRRDAVNAAETMYSEQPLFYVEQCGIRHPMSDDNVRKFLKKYGKAAKEFCPDVPDNIHPHLWRHSRAMHLYHHGMALSLISQWLGHSNLETTLIYAYADTEQKRKAIEKSMGREVIAGVDIPKYCVSDEEILKKLYGLK